MMRVCAILAMFALGACLPAPVEPPPARAQITLDSLPAMKTFSGTHGVRTANRANADIAQDFLDLTFRMESGRTLPVMTRFEGPITVRLVGASNPTLDRDLRLLVERLRREAGIDIRVTDAPSAAITIETVSRQALQQAVPGAACFVVPNVASWSDYNRLRRTSSVDWVSLRQRERAAVFLPVDVPPQEARDCLHEELAQALGPLDDLYRLSDSVFNDDNMQSVLTSFDMLILRAYYAPELANGMTRAAVAARLPALLARLNPGGIGGQQRGVSQTDRAWIDAIETALGQGLAPDRRRSAALRAINISRDAGWTDGRAGFALYAYGRLQTHNAPETARAALNAADLIYRQSTDTDIHAAHVAVQLASFALAGGDGQTALRLAQEAIPIAAAHENAALLATLMMIKAEALDLLGRADAAAAVRLDSLGWARYGFGSDRNVRDRLREVAALRPAKES